MIIRMEPLLEQYLNNFPVSHVFPGIQIGNRGSDAIEVRI